MSRQLLLSYLLLVIAGTLRAEANTGSTIRQTDPSLNERHPVLSQRTPCVPKVEATHFPVTGEGKFGSVTGRQSSSPVRYDSSGHGAPRWVTGTNTHRSWAPV